MPEKLYRCLLSKISINEKIFSCLLLARGAILLRAIGKAGKNALKYYGKA